MEELGDDKPSAIFDIVENGAIVLVVGPNNVKLRVHSLILKTASRMFSAMFEPTWNEGKNAWSG